LHGTCFFKLPNGRVLEGMIRSSKVNRIAESSSGWMVPDSIRNYKPETRQERKSSNKKTRHKGRAFFKKNKVR
jgi:hypothetical protein